MRRRIRVGSLLGDGKDPKLFALSFELSCMRDSRQKRIVSNGSCDKCGLELESTLYVLRDCPMAQRILK